MKIKMLFLAVTWLLLGKGGEAYAQEAVPLQESIIAEIRKKGGTVEVLPESRGLRISMSGPKFGDADLAKLKSIDDLQALHLSLTRVTDAGMTHLQGLAHLEVLDCSDTSLTDEGLVPLTVLPRLKSLNLRNTKVTYSGLAHIRQMKQLEVVNLWSTRVTEAGVRQLQTDMPGVEVRYYFHLENVKRRARSALVAVLPLGILGMAFGGWLVKSSLRRKEVGDLLRIRSFVFGVCLSLFCVVAIVLTGLRACGFDVTVADLWR